MDLNTLVPRVQEGVVGCPYPVIMQALRDSVIHFCERTFILKSKEVIPLVQGVDTYDLPTIAGHVPIQVERVSIDGVALDPQWEDRLPIQGMEDRPCTFYLTYDKKIVMVPTPNKDYNLTLDVVLKLKRRDVSNEVPDMLIEDWEHAIVAGAKYYLFKMYKKPWGSGRQAEFNLREFRDAISVASKKVKRSFTTRSNRVRYQKFGG